MTGINKENKNLLSKERGDGEICVSNCPEFQASYYFNASSNVLS